MGRDNNLAIGWYIIKSILISILTLKHVIYRTIDVNVLVQPLSIKHKLASINEQVCEATIRFVC